MPGRERRTGVIPKWLVDSSAFRKGRVESYIEDLERVTVLADRVMAIGSMGNATWRRTVPDLVSGAEKVMVAYRRSPDRVVAGLAMGAVEAVEAVGGGALLLQKMAEEMGRGKAGDYAGKLLKVLTKGDQASWQRRLELPGSRRQRELIRDLVLGRDGEWGKQIGGFLLSPYLLGLQLIVYADELGQTGELLTRISLQSLKTAVVAARKLNPVQVADDVELVRSMSGVARELKGKIQNGVDARPISNLGATGFERADSKKLGAAVSDVAVSVTSDGARLAQVMETRQQAVARLIGQMRGANASMMGTAAGIAAGSGAETANAMAVVTGQIGMDSLLNLVSRQVVAAALAARVTAEYLLSGSIGREVSIEIEREASGQFGQLRHLDSKIRVDGGIIEGEFRNE